eukprot:SAG11_NODE_13723_length_642_cov_1.189687_1_plen_135_part_10
MHLKYYRRPSLVPSAHVQPSCPYPSKLSCGWKSPSHAGQLPHPSVAWRVAAAVHSALDYAIGWVGVPTRQKPPRLLEQYLLIARPPDHMHPPARPQCANTHMQTLIRCYVLEIQVPQKIAMSSRCAVCVGAGGGG